MNIESNTGVIGFVKVVLLIISSICTAIAAISYTRISYRSRALEFYKSEIEALRAESDLHKLQIKELAEHLDAEKAKAEKMSHEVKTLRGRTDYTIVETTIKALTCAVESNIAAMAKSVTDVSIAVTNMQIQCARHQAGGDRREDDSVVQK